MRSLLLISFVFAFSGLACGKNPVGAPAVYSLPSVSSPQSQSQPQTQPQPQPGPIAQATPVYISPQPTSVTVALGGQAQFMARIAPPFSGVVVWQFKARAAADFVDLTVAPAETLTINSTTVGAVGSYRAKVFITNGPQVFSNVVTLDVPILAGLSLNCQMQNLKLTIPMSGVQSVDWNVSNSYAFHVYQMAGQPVLSSIDGVVEIAQANSPGLEDAATVCPSSLPLNTVRIRHDSGFFVTYNNLLRGSVPVVVGQKVTSGQRIGSVGFSCSTDLPGVSMGVNDCRNLSIDPYVNNLWVTAPLSNLPMRVIRSGVIDESLGSAHGARVVGGLVSAASVVSVPAPPLQSRVSPFLVVENLPQTTVTLRYVYFHRYPVCSFIGQAEQLASDNSTPLPVFAARLTTLRSNSYGFVDTRPYNVQNGGSETCRAQYTRIEMSYLLNGTALTPVHNVNFSYPP